MSRKVEKDIIKYDSIDDIIYYKLHITKKYKTCPACKGAGEYKVDMGTLEPSHIFMCAYCKGAGKIFSHYEESTF